MSKRVIIDCRKTEYATHIQMAIGNVSATYKRAGEVSVFNASGRGNVRQVKALLREFLRNSDRLLT
ncbi:TPA: hypothetical protein SMF36_000314 [Serratia marcescens]|nr:hypothetical protein [Serratia marcescens]HEJ6977255.1 hypothetical protein [Serratia marcescens]